MNRTVIVGGGVVGLSAAYTLARRGVGEVVVIERAGLCSGGTGRSSGVVRAHYGVPSLAAMAWRGVEAFERATDELGADIGFEQTGYVVVVAERDAAALRANVAMHTALGIDVALLGPDEVADLWPHADLSDVAAAAFEPRGGYGDASSTGMAFAAAARRHGAVIRQQTPAAAIRSDGQSVRGVTLASGERIDADVVVVAAGVWSVGLCAPLGVHLPIRAQREQILVVEPGVDLGRVPVLSDLVHLQYVRPERSGSLLVGSSDHSDPEFVDADHYAQRPDEDHVEAAAARLMARFPRLDPALTHGYCGCYDVTPDYNPLIGPAGPDGLLVAAGFSGHGFKIAPAVGELVADLVVGRDSADPRICASDFRPSRFADDAPLVSAHRYVGAGQMR